MSDILKQLTVERLAQYFDHTQLKADAAKEDLVKLCSEAKEYGFKMVAINPVQVKLCKDLLAKTPVHIGATVGFPLGQNTKEIKRLETIQCIEDGSDEIDYVINISELKNKNYSYIEEEMDMIVQECRKKEILSKVIFENCYLTNSEKEELCRISLNIRPDFIKTSTGFGTSGATFDDVKLMKSIVKDKVKVKAAGGIRNLDTALKMIELGADRIGAKASVEIIKEFMNR